MRPASPWHAIRRLLATAGLIAAILFGGCGSEDTERLVDSDWGVPDSPETVLGYSTTVVVGAIQTVEQQTVDLRSPVDGAVHGRRDEDVWRVRVFDVLRGDVVPGDVIEVRVTTHVEMDRGPGKAPSDSDIHVVQPRHGVEHVFFLAEFSGEGGDGIGLAGPIAVAELLPDERLDFLVPAPYRLITDKPDFTTPNGRLRWDDELDLALLRDLERTIAPTPAANRAHPSAYYDPTVASAELPPP